MENETKHSLNFINKKMGNEPSFSGPTDYFEGLEFDIESKIAEENFNKETAFKIPEAYFSTLEDRILEDASIYKKPIKVISFKDRILKAIPFAAAASIILFIGLNAFVFSTDNKFTVDAISDNDIEYWLDENTVYTNEIATFFENDILDEHAFSFTDIKDESIEDYINSIDNSSLLNELN